MNLTFTRAATVLALAVGFVALGALVTGFLFESMFMREQTAPLWLAAGLFYPVLYVFSLSRSVIASKNSNFDRALSWGMAPVLYAGALSAVLLTSGGT